jgi:glycosyltransferase involved in cell wall biosynthesis
VRILNICSKNEPGGSNQRAFDSMHSYNAKGHSCETWFLQHRCGLFFGQGIKNLSNSKDNFFQYFKILFSLIIQIIKYKPDAVFIYARIIPPLAVFLSGVRKRVVVQTCLPKDYHKSGGSPKWSYYLDIFWGFLGFYTDIVVVSNTSLKEYLKYPKFYTRHIKKIDNGIKYSVYEGPKQECLTKLGFTDEKVLGYVGRHTSTKNVGFLINCLKHLPNYYHLLIAGDGPETPYLMYALEDSLIGRVRFLGNIRHDRVSEFMHCLDIYVSASTTESFGLSIIEAALSRIPIVAKSIDAINETIGEDAYFSVKDLNEKEFSSVIQNVDSSKIELAYTRAKRYSFESMVNNYLDLIK